MPALTLRQRSIFWLVVNAICWGAALPVVKPALSSISPFAFLTYRFMAAGIITLPLLLSQLHKLRPLGKNLFTILWVELIGTTLALGLLYEGLERTSALDASLIVTMTPVFMVLGGVLFLRESQEKHEWIGLVLALVGTIIFVVEPILAGRDRHTSEDSSLVGNLLVIVQNIVTVAYYLLAKRKYHRLPKLLVTSVSFWIGAISFGALTLWQSQLALAEFWQQTLLDFQIPSVILAVLYMATFGSIIGLTAYIKGQDGIEASEAGLFVYLEPLVYVPLAVLFLNERLSIVVVGAMALVGYGVFLAERRRPRSRGRLQIKSPRVKTRRKLART